MAKVALNRNENRVCEGFLLASELASDRVHHVGF